MYFQLFRHGDRSPTFKYKTDSLANAFPEEKGDLTKVNLNNYINIIKVHRYINQKTNRFFNLTNH